jgi:hypothetical protein
MTSPFIAPPPRRNCSAPRCSECGRPDPFAYLDDLVYRRKTLDEAREPAPVCRCAFDANAACRAHPLRPLEPTRSHFLVVGLLCIAIAVAVALWFVGSELR